MPVRDPFENRPSVYADSRCFAFATAASVGSSSRFRDVSNATNFTTTLVRRKPNCLVQARLHVLPRILCLFPARAHRRNTRLASGAEAGPAISRDAPEFRRGEGIPDRDGLPLHAAALRSVQTPPPWCVWRQAHQEARNRRRSCWCRSAAAADYLDGVADAGRRGFTAAGISRESLRLFPTLSENHPHWNSHPRRVPCKKNDPNDLPPLPAHYNPDAQGGVSPHCRRPHGTGRKDGGLPGVRR